MKLPTAILALALPAAPVLAQLDPPPGPVAPSFKTLDQVEPRTPLSDETTPGDADNRFIISEPGSYYLGAEMLDVQTDTGILITAHDVTLDLGGFTLRGGNGARYGVRVSGPVDNVALRNGTVTGWGQAGIDLALSNGAGMGCLVENIRATKNGSVGIYAGVGAVVRACVALENGSAGISVFDRGTIENCESRLNEGNGIVLRGVGVIRDCTADQNDFTGIHTNDAVTIESCSATNNGAHGVLAVSAATVSGSSAYGNAEHGFTLGAGTTITGSAARSNQVNGIVVGPGSTVSGCTADSNGGDGVSTGTATISGCSARENGDDGFVVGFAGSITNCTALDNAGDGIELFGRTTATNNTCNRNGYNGDGAGIHISVNGYCRVESNNLSENDIGIHVEVHSNFIARNVLSLNTVQFNISAGNNVGEIVAAPPSGAIVGSGIGAAAGMGTTDPYANFVE